jgi:hypothetical protein
MPFGISGTAGLTFNDSTTQSTAAPLPIGTTWTNMTSSRSLGVTYTNTTGKYIQVIVGGSTYGSGGGFNLIINGVSLPPIFAYSGAVGTASACALVPPGATYLVTQYGESSYTGWYELR